MSSATPRRSYFKHDGRTDSHLRTSSQHELAAFATLSPSTEQIIYYVSEHVSEWTSLFKPTEPIGISTIWHAYIEPSEKYPQHRHLEEVSDGSSRVEFDEGLSLRIEITMQDDRYSVADNKFGIYGFGLSKEEALFDYEQFFVKFFRDITETPESELAESTLRYKHTLQAFGTLVTDE